MDASEIKPTDAFLRLKVNDLKEICLAGGLARSGRKADLQQRILTAAKHAGRVQQALERLNRASEQKSGEADAYSGRPKPQIVNSTLGAEFGGVASEVYVPVLNPSDAPLRVTLVPPCEAVLARTAVEDALASAQAVLANVRHAKSHTRHARLVRYLNTTSRQILAAWRGAGGVAPAAAGATHRRGGSS